MNRLLLSFSAALFCFAMVSTASATPLTVGDPSIELGILDAGDYGSSSPNWVGGWYATQGAWGLEATVPDGTQAYASGNTYQILTDTFQEGATYDLTAYIYNRGATTAGQENTNSGFYFFHGDQVPTFNAGDAGTYIASILHTSTHEFVAQTLSYTATAADAGHTIGIAFNGGNYFDLVSVEETSVPEPSAFILGGLGLLGLGWFGYRRRNG